MADENQPCAHPRMCPEQDDFTARVKTQKLSLEPPPPADLVPRPPRHTKSTTAEEENE